LENTEKLSFFVIAMVIPQVVEEEAQFCCSLPAKSGNILAVQRSPTYLVVLLIYKKDRCRYLKKWKKL